MPHLSRFFKTIFSAMAIALSAMAFTSCHHLDNHRLHVGYVNLTFLTQGDWTVYGVSGAGQWKRFIISERIPSNFPYTALMSTGVGGILLCTTYTAEPVAYDLACPVECRADVRVFVNEDNEAECPKCHSRYDIFESLGHPIAGPAAEDGFGLQIYRVGPGPRGEFMTVSL